MSLITSTTPRSLKLKSILEQVGEAAQGAMADKELEAEMLRTLRAAAKDTSTAAAKDRRQLTKARVITSEDVVRLRDERLRIDAQNAARAEARRRKQKVVAAEGSAGSTTPKHGKKHVRIEENDLAELEDSLLALELSDSPHGSENEGVLTLEEDNFVHLDAILAPASAKVGRGKGKEVEKRPEIVTRSGRRVKVVNLDK
jgi:hypothetical protein